MARSSQVVSKQTSFAESGTSPTSKSAEPLLVPLKVAANLLGVKVYSIRRLTRKGVLKYRIIGNRWLVSVASIRQFANGGAA